MSDRLERVLALLDAGAQSSTESGHTTEWPGRCARCQRHDPMPDGDLCGGCRAFLLGDVDEDPRAFRAYIDFDAVVRRSTHPRQGTTRRTTEDHTA